MAVMMQSPLLMEGRHWRRMLLMTMMNQ